MMKTGIAALGALSLINMAAAQPSGHNHRRHQQLHDKRQDVVYETDYTYVTTQLPNVIVYVDENNVPYSTSTEGQAPATSVAAASTSVAAASTPATSAAAASTPAFSIDTKAKNVAYNNAPVSSSSVWVAPAPTSSATTLASVVVPSSSSQAAYTTSQAAASTKAPSGSGYGMVYSPYRADHNCKSQDEVNSDFAKINSWAQSNGENWNLVRSYGADCNQVETMNNAAKQYGVKLFAGIYDVMNGDERLNKELTLLIDQVKGDWSNIQTISIGNEVVNNGQLDVDGVGRVMATARSRLSAAGYTGPVVAVDTFIAMISHPGLCKLSDYPAVNAHAFFDANTPAELAGTWVLSQMQLVSAACDGADTWITETGWPTEGSTNGLAIPGFSQQQSALSSIKKAVSSNLIMFSAFNDLWKSNNPGTFNAEQHWGICN